MTAEHDRIPDDPIRALREPFILSVDWDPLHGHCNKCKAPAVLYEDRWHHDGKGCDPRTYGPAEFILGDPVKEAPDA